MVGYIFLHMVDVYVFFVGKYPNYILFVGTSAYNKFTNNGTHLQTSIEATERYPPQN